MWPPWPVTKKKCRQICTSLNSWTLQHIHRFFSTKGGRIKLSSGFQPSRWQNTHFELISIIVSKLPVFFLGGGEETVGIMGVISSKASPKKCFTSGHVRPSAVQKGKSELEKGSDEIACSNVKVIRFFTFKTLPLDTFQPFLSFCHICFNFFQNTSTGKAGLDMDIWSWRCPSYNQTPRRWKAPKSPWSPDPTWRFPSSAFWGSPKSSSHLWQGNHWI